jgi:hypothetical protein
MPWDKLGLGRVAHILTVQKAIEENVTSIDAGRGFYDFKLNLGGETLKVILLRITADNLMSRVKAVLITKLSSIIHLLYYRIWFNRISPLLPFKRHHLWELWIRTRI